jgi:hypothetical protein
MNMKVNLGGMPTTRAAPRPAIGVLVRRRSYASHPFTRGWLHVSFVMARDSPYQAGYYKKTLWPLVRKRTIPTGRQPFVGEI